MTRVPSPPIIAAVDAFAGSASPARCAGWLAEASSSPLQLVYVLDAGELPSMPRVEPLLQRELYARQEEEAHAVALDRLNVLSRELRGASSSAMVVHGQPVPALQALAAEEQAALLVTGTAAREGLEHVLQGSVSGRLAAAAPCPVVIVAPGDEVGEAGPVLVGDDGSDHADRAVHHAAALADRLGRDLFRMEAAGDPVQELAAAGREHRACLIATGTRGRGPIRAELFGSVSSGMVQTADRPIMLVPASAGEPPSPHG